MQGQRGSRKAVLPQERVTQRLGEVTWVARAGPGGGDRKQAETGRQVPLLGKRVPLGFQARHLCHTRPRGGGRGFPALAGEVRPCPGCGSSHSAGARALARSEQKQNPN